MPPIPEAFSGVWAKIDWADHQLQELQRREYDISKANRQFIESKEDADTRQRIYYLTRDPIIPPGFAVLIGSIIQALRSALDYLAWGLCCAGTGGKQAAEARMKEIYFPVTSGSASDYKVLSQRTVIETLAKPGAIKAIDEIQPYKGGAGRLLVYLNEFNRADKHRLLITVAFCNPMRDPSSAGEFTQGIAILREVMRFGFGIARQFGFGTPIPRALKAGDELFRIPLDDKTGENVDLVFQIALHEPEILSVAPALELLHHTAHLVRRIVPVFNEFV